jgi:hydrogenase maturation factor
MCVEFPGVVVERDGDLVTVSTEGRQRRALALLYPDLAPGEWVLVAAGTVVGRLDADEAARLRAEVGQARGVTP